MFYLCFISVVDSRDIENLKYKKFKFKTSLIIESQKELIELRNKVNLYYNTNNISVYDYTKWAIKNIPYGKNQCKPRTYKIHFLSEVFSDNLAGEFEE